jgi:hypothetical protein
VQPRRAGRRMSLSEPHALHAPISQGVDMSAIAREFRVLGPVEVVLDGRSAAIGAAKPRTLLALLLLDANRPVERDWLIDQLCAAQPEQGLRAGGRRNGGRAAFRGPGQARAAGVAAQPVRRGHHRNARGPGALARPRFVRRHRCRGRAGQGKAARRSAAGGRRAVPGRGAGVGLARRHRRGIGSAHTRASAA